jgi:hypothetical protein
MSPPFTQNMGMNNTADAAHNDAMIYKTKKETSHFLPNFAL